MTGTGRKGGGEGERVTLIGREGRGRGRVTLIGREGRGRGASDTDRKGVGQGDRDGKRGGPADVGREGARVTEIERERGPVCH